MVSLYHIMLVVHIIAGAVALLSGLIALGLFKSTPKHKLYGKAFFYAMVVIFITAVLLSLYRGLDFLLCIAFLSFYSAYRGVRALKFLKGARFAWYDYLSGGAVMCAGLYLVIQGAGYGLDDQWSGMIIAGAFGLLTMALAVGSMREGMRMPSGSPAWFRTHKSAMGGALIATMTAFTVTAVDFLPDLVRWLGPTLLLTPALSYIIRLSERGTATEKQDSQT